MPLALLGPILLGAAGTSAAATTAAWGAIAAGTMATTGLIGASKQAGAAKDAAQLQVDAANHGADVQAKTAADTLAWNKQQAETQWQNDEVNRKANYDQWAAKRQNVGSIGQMLLGSRFTPSTIPGYVPSIDPRYLDGATPVPAGSGQTPAAAAPPGAMTPPASFGAAVNSGQARSPLQFRAPAPPPAAAPPPQLDPRLMGGNTGITGGMGMPVLQPDGTYALPGSMPRYGSFGAYLGAA